MSSKSIITFSVLALACMQGALAATVSLIAPGFQDAKGVQGQAVGTGADGTTFVVSGSQTFIGSDTSLIPFTMTIVQGATRVSEAVKVVQTTVIQPDPTETTETAAITQTFGIEVETECNLQNGRCVGELEIFGADTLSVTDTTTFATLPTLVVVVSDQEGISTPTAPVPSGSNTSSPSSTDKRVTDTDGQGPESTDLPSGATRNAIVGLASMLPLGLGLFMTM